MAIFYEYEAVESKAGSEKLDQNLMLISHTLEFWILFCSMKIHKKYEYMGFILPFIHSFF